MSDAYQYDVSTANQKHEEYWAAFREMDDKSQLREIMRRPGMYVGTPRLDYIRHFADGLRMCRRATQDNPWDSNYELQHWLLTRCSASIRHCASLHGWTLFFRCFGIRETAVARFAEFLHDTIPANTGSHASWEIWELQKSLKDAGQERHREVILECLRAMADCAGLPYDSIRVYIHRECYFQQIRFVFHTEAGWWEDCSVTPAACSYEHLIRLHAHVDCLEMEDLIRLRVDGVCFNAYHSEEWTGERIADIGHQITDEETLEHIYQQWKARETCSY